LQLQFSFQACLLTKRELIIADYVQLLQRTDARAAKPHSRLRHKYCGRRCHALNIMTIQWYSRQSRFYQPQTAWGKIIRIATQEFRKARRFFTRCLLEYRKHKKAQQSPDSVETLRPTWRWRSRIQVALCGARWVEVAAKHHRSVTRVSVHYAQQPMTGDKL